MFFMVSVFIQQLFIPLHLTHFEALYCSDLSSCICVKCFFVLNSLWFKLSQMHHVHFEQRRGIPDEREDCSGVVHQWRSLIPLSTLFAIMPLNSYETLALLVSRNLFGPVLSLCVTTRWQHCFILNRVEKRWALFIFTNKEWQIQVKKKTISSIFLYQCSLR